MGNKLEVPTVDLSGKVAIVTGGNTGIGYELVKGLAEMGAHTIMASRSEERATAVRGLLKYNVAGLYVSLHVYTLGSRSYKRKF